MGLLSIDLGYSVKEIFGEKSSWFFCSSLDYVTKKRIVYANSMVLGIFSIAFFVVSMSEIFAVDGNFSHT